jgi:hypothetical protein
MKKRTTVKSSTNPDVEAALEEVAEAAHVGAAPVRGLTDGARDALKDAYREDFAREFDKNPGAWSLARYWILPLASLVGLNGASRMVKAHFPKPAPRVDAKRALQAAAWVATYVCPAYSGPGVRGKWCKGLAVKRGRGGARKR